MKRTVIMGGGTFNPIRNHLALSAPAFGKTAKELHKMMPGSELVLTKMADSSSNLITNKDVENYLDSLMDDPSVSVLILNCALCDFEAKVGDVESGLMAKRLKTKDGEFQLTLTPSDKLIGKIRKKRPDIFLIGFKTTTGEERMDQFLIALKMMKSTKCNLVLANDLHTKNNMVITAEETIYGESTDRAASLKELVEIINLRSNLTYHRTDFIESDNTPMSETPKNFQEVVQFLIDNGGFIENNGNGFTPGHFCYKNAELEFLSSQRKSDHRKVFSEGLTRIIVKDLEKFSAYGKRKPSVGARSQWLLLSDNLDYDCIVHTHNPLKENSPLNSVEQRPFQCGSLECGQNTLNGLKDYAGIKAVYLDKHGANILFKSSEDPKKVIAFIKDNLELGVKAT